MKEVKYMYVVTARKWGERETHSYTVGVFSKKNAAMKYADMHTEYRGGKYACIVEKCILDEYKDDKEFFITYRTKSILQELGD